MNLKWIMVLYNTDHLGPYPHDAHSNKMFDEASWFPAPANIARVGLSAAWELFSPIRCKWRVQNVHFKQSLNNNYYNKYINK